MIYISRNPKDTAVSMYHYYRENPNLPTVDTWTAFLDLFLKGDGKDRCSVFFLQLILLLLIFYYYSKQKELRNINFVKLLAELLIHTSSDLLFFHDKL